MNDLIFYVDSRYLKLSADYDITLKHYELSDPEIRKFECDVPFSNGLVDCHYALTSNPIYENREAKFECKIYFEQAALTLQTYITFVSGIHGRIVKFNLLDDYLESGFLYEGRVHVGTLESGDDAWTFDITIDTKPYATLDLPSGYTAYEYIQNSSGNSVLVEPDFNLNNNTGFRVLGALNYNSGTTWTREDGLITSNVDPDLSFPVFDPTETKWKFRYPTSSSASTWFNTAEGHSAATDWVSVDAYLNYLNTKSQAIHWDDDTWDSVALPSTTYDVDTTIRFMQSNGHCLRRINEIWITQGSTITHHYIPVQRTTDSYVGLYDLVDRVAIVSTIAQAGTVSNVRDTRRL